MRRRANWVGSALSVIVIPILAPKLHNPELLKP